MEEEKNSQGTYSPSAPNPCLKKFWFIDPDIKDLYVGVREMREREGEGKGGWKR